MRFGTPEEMQAAMLQAQMAGVSFKHDVNRWLHEMAPEDLVTFRLLLDQCAANPEIVHYLSGMIVQIMELKHNVCAGCGKNHDEELLGPQAVDNPVDNGTPPGETQLSLFAEGELDPIAPQEPLPEGVPIGWVAEVPNMGPAPQEPLPVAEVQSAMSPAEEAAATADNMIEYQLGYIVRDAAHPGAGERYLGCTGCGMEYSSVADRMLRPPGVKGCEGCQHKAKWG